MSMGDAIRDHLRLYAEDPEKAHIWDASSYGGPGPRPTVLLTTRGRRSGADRVVPLVYGRSGEQVVVVASKGGAPSHPAWFLNLEADPRCHVQVAREHFDGVARVANADERGALWSLMLEIHPEYDDYQARSKDREIPVVVIEASTSDA